MTAARTTLASLSQDIQTEADAYRYWEALRWGDTPRCAHCGGEDVFLIVPKNGTSRRTAGGTMSERRVWRCRPCKKQFSVITGTMMHATKVPIQTWVLVVFDACTARNGISAREVERKYGAAPGPPGTCCTASGRRWRTAPASCQTTSWPTRRTTGGNPRNRHQSQRKVDYAVGRGTDKAPVVALIEAETGETRSAVVPDVTGATMIRVLRESTDMPMTTLHTDAWQTYRMVASFVQGHHYVDHSAGQFVSDKSWVPTRPRRFSRSSSGA